MQIPTPAPFQHIKNVQEFDLSELMDFTLNGKKQKREHNSSAAKVCFPLKTMMTNQTASHSFTNPSRKKT